MASAQLLELQEELRALKQSVEGAGQENISIDELRENGSVIGALASEPDLKSIDRLDVGGCEAVRLVPHSSTPGLALLWLHGGGYGVLSAETHSRMCGHFANALKADVFVLDFRRAPENVYPAALDDAVSACQWLSANGYGTLIIGGDSGGAGHAVATMLKLRDTGNELPAASILISGWYDLNLTNESLVERFDRDLTNSAEIMAILRDNYLAGHSADDPYASPVFGDLHGLPPAYITVCEEEMLYDDTMIFAKKARASGVDLELEIVELMPHVHTFWAGNIPEADESIRRMARWLNSVVKPEQLA